MRKLVIMVAYSLYSVLIASLWMRTFAVLLLRLASCYVVRIQEEHKEEAK